MQPSFSRLELESLPSDNESQPFSSQTPARSIAKMRPDGLQIRSGKYMLISINCGRIDWRAVLASFFFRCSVAGSNRRSLYKATLVGLPWTAAWNHKVFALTELIVATKAVLNRSASLHPPSAILVNTTPNLTKICPFWLINRIWLMSCGFHQKKNIFRSRISLLLKLCRLR